MWERRTTILVLPLLTNCAYLKGLRWACGHLPIGADEQVRIGTPHTPAE
jgi:hypothetical protein